VGYVIGGLFFGLFFLGIGYIVRKKKGAYIGLTMGVSMGIAGFIEDSLGIPLGILGIFAMLIVPAWLLNHYVFDPQEKRDKQAQEKKDQNKG